MSKASSVTEGLERKNVTLFIGSKTYLLSGDWEWDLNAASVFCSDVMLELPIHFMGTKSILHPEDRSNVEKALVECCEEKKISLQFRIITTYGELKTLSGKNIQCKEKEASEGPVTGLLEKTEKQEQEEEQFEQGAALRKAQELAELLIGTGSWYSNTVTNKTWFSDGVYRIYGFPAQSLNAHLHTFSSFILPEDKGTVQDVFEQAYSRQLPLHIEYRIIKPDGECKYIALTTRWDKNTAGEMILSGIVQDQTERKFLEHQSEELQHKSEFLNQQLKLSEQNAGIGYWETNLLTRKSSYSQNYYRLFGVKPPQPISSSSFFMTYVHPDDLETVLDAFKKMRSHHEPPDLEYRIIRPDGKTRWLKQKGKLVTYGNRELVMVGTLQDSTVLKGLEKKINELNEELSTKNHTLRQAEEMTGQASWLWEIQTGKITWSENFYRFLKFKPHTIELTLQRFLKSIYPEDRKRFTDALNLAVQEKMDTDLHFRLACPGTILQVKASFRLMVYEGKDYFIATLQDVSKEHDMQVQLQQWRQMTESITENILDRAIITDTENTIKLWNNRCEEAYKIKKEEAIGKNIFDVFPQLKNEEDIVLFSRALKGEPIHALNVKATLSHEYHNMHLIPLEDKEGAVTGILHLLHGVTKEVELREQLNERLAFIESLVEASVNRIIVMDRHMNYLYCNRKAADHYGFKKEDLIGKNVLEVFPNSINDPSYQHFRKALKGEIVHIPAIEGFMDEHYCQVYLIPILNDQDEVTAVLWMHNDLSHEIKLQRKLRKADELLNNINEAYAELDEEGMFRYVNHKAEELWKKSKEELLGQNIWEVFPQYVGLEEYNIITKALKEKIKSANECFSVSAGQWLYMSATPIDGGAIVLFYDISDVKEAREKLLQEHYWLKQAQAMGHIGNFEWISASNTLYWSDELYRIYGLEPQSETMTLEKLMQFIYPDDQERVAAEIERSMLDHKTINTSYRIIRPNAEVRYVNRELQIIANEEGEVTSVRGVIRDITEQKRTDIILDTINEVCFELDEQLNFTYANRKAFDGWTKMPDEVIGRNILEVFPEYAGTPFYEVIIKAATTKTQVLEELYSEAIDKWICVNANPSLSGLIILHFDVTKQVKAREQIRKHQEEFKLLVENIPDVVNRWDANLKLIYANSAFETWMGIAKTNFYGKTINEMGYPDEIALHWTEKLKEVFKTGKPVWQYNIVSKPNGVAHFHSHLVPEFNEEGAVQSVLLIARDITAVTERKNAEEGTD